MALTEREVQLNITAVDGASPVLKQVGATAQQTGQSVKQSMKDAADSMDKAGVSADRLNKFIREQRAESRQQAFLFRESKDAIGAAAAGLASFGLLSGNATGKMKDLSNALNQGYVAFQGMDFLLASLGVGGPAGMAIAGVAGLAAAMISLDVETGDAAKQLENYNKILEETIQLRIRSGEIPLESGIEKLRKELEETERGIEIAKRSGADWTFLEKHRLELLEKIKGRQEEISAITRNALSTLYPEAAKKLEEENRLQKAATIIIENRNRLFKAGRFDELKALDELIAKYKAYYAYVPVMKLSPLPTGKDFKLPFSLPKVKDHVPTMNETRQLAAYSLDIGRGWETFLTSMQDGIRSVSASIGEDFYNAFDRAFNGVNSLFEKFLVGLGESAVRMLSDIAMRAGIASLLNLIPGFGGIASFLAPFMSFHQGGTVPKAHEGAYVNAPASRSVPILVRGGETIRTERQEGSIQRSLSATRAISARMDKLADAILSMIEAPVVGVVNVDGGQLMLRREWPELEQFNSKKYQ